MLCCCCCASHSYFSSPLPCYYYYYYYYLMGDFSCRTGCEVWSMSEVFPRWFDYFLHKNPHRRGSQWLEVWNPCEFFLLLPYSLVWFFLRWPFFQIITIKNLYSIFKSKFTFLWDTKSFLYVRCFYKIWFKGPDCPDEGWRSVKPVSSFFAFISLDTSIVQILGWSAKWVVM